MGNEKMTDAEFRAAFASAADPLIKFLNEHPDRLNPHYTVIVTPISAELLSGEMSHRTNQHIKD